MAWLIIIGERQGLRWVLEHERMAVREHVRGRPAAGDRFALYVSRGAFHNPGRDEAQILAIGVFETPVERFTSVIAEQEYQRSARLSFESVLPERHGLAFKPLVDSMSFIAKKESWFAYIRRTLTPIPETDFKIIERSFKKLATATKQ